MVRTAIISPLNKSFDKIKKEEVTQQSAANDHDEVVVPILSSSDDNPDIPYFAGFPAYPQVQLTHYDEEPAHNEGPLRRGDEFKGDVPLPNEGPDYYDENQETDYKRNPKRSPKPKMYKAVERVYYYPQDEGESEPSKNRRELNAMKEYIPENYGPYDHNEDADDGPEDYGNRNSHHSIQMQGNPPSNDHQENYDNSDEQESDGTQVSIANDVKEFGKEAVDEANRFEKFLNNLRNFAVDSEKEYSTPKEKQNHESDNPIIYQDDTRNTNFRDSMAANPSDDRTRDYEQVGQYGSPDDYDKEKRSYQNQRDKINKGGHKYHKDRRRPRKPISDEEMEQQRQEVSSLIDSEPDEADYLSNTDVVNQLKKSELKYNTGIDPVYSSQKDFEEVKRLEKIIENVALLNKEKEKNAAEAHDQQEISETSLKNIQIKDGVKIKQVKKKSENN
jgi:hypothetical protein